MFSGLREEKQPANTKFAGCIVGYRSPVREELCGEPQLRLAV
jgi:hypothetical protein